MTTLLPLLPLLLIDCPSNCFPLPPAGPEDSSEQPGAAAEQRQQQAQQQQPKQQPPPPQEEERDLFVPVLVVVSLLGYAITAGLAWWEYNIE